MGVEGPERPSTCSQCFQGLKYTSSLGRIVLFAPLLHCSDQLGTLLGLGMAVVAADGVVLVGHDTTSHSPVSSLNRSSTSSSTMQRSSGTMIPLAKVPSRAMKRSWKVTGP